MNNEALYMLDFIASSPTAFQTIENIEMVFKKAQFIELKENKTFKLEKNKNYYISRNGSSIIGIKVGKKLEYPSFMIAASHSDCPSFKLKPNSLIINDNYISLNTEGYGGALYSPWFDRPLSLAGRLIIKEDNKIIARPFMLQKDFCIIPSVAIHMNREANNGFKLNPQVDLLPLVSQDKDFDLKQYLADEIKLSKDDLIAYDLYLYPRSKGFLWGKDNEFLSSHHLDNLESAFTSLDAFLRCDNGENNINIFVCFDNEEVGSLTRQGAASDFLANNLARIAEALNLQYPSILADSMLLSIDNAHAGHPNHPEYNDKNNHAYMNKGIVIKYNANQSYTSDALSSAVFIEMLNRKNIPYQYYANRSDIRGGSTLGNLSNNQLSLLSLDIGLAQLAMHSPLETAGSRDVTYMIAGIKEFYKSHLYMHKDGHYSIIND